jgi:hypothetical protein
MATSKAGHIPPPSVVRGRKGGISVADALVAALWNPSGNSSDWPERTLEDLRIEVTRRLGYGILDSTVRSALYTNSTIFERCGTKSQRVLYRLTKTIKAMKMQPVNAYVQKLPCP